MVKWFLDMEMAKVIISPSKPVGSVNLFSLASFAWPMARSTTNL
ncbi:hypothetical protein SLEP1_g2034 [Rubroshorea leprosula]|uniref:Uncharacterized protein n=1 Tax=Rubroshorea leprosula TaxID=152421 RepID=A0AAV5HMD3_9ROSI|nr:hypothetical protein SLEP1_g2034 [Rubroshorea leprosula]